MDIRENVPLSEHSTMRLGGTARYLVEITSKWDVGKAWQWAQERDLPVIMIGDGSNIVWRDEGFSGLVMVNRIKGYDDYAEDARSHYITVGAGENWDNVVARTTQAGLTGVEALSLIPGTAGATPVQNVGAYGQEVARTITSIEVFDTTTGQLTNVPHEACGFGYRKSNFQTEYRDRFFITGVTFHLYAENPKPPFYGAVEHYLAQNPPTGNVTPQIIRDAVIAIRTAKLPDPAIVANNGSFFANPIVSGGELVELQAEYDNMPCWPNEDGGAKIPAAWLIEQAGFKDYHDSETGMATWPTQPLVLVNEHAKTTNDLLSFKQKIVDAVQSKFSITLQQEPELLPLREI